MKRVVVCIVFISLLFTGCMSEEEQKKIYNEKYKIVSNEYDSFYSMKKVKYIDNGVRLKFKDFEGMSGLIKVEGEGTLLLKYSGNVESGSYKLVLIKTEEEIIKEVELKGNYNDQFTVDLEQGEYFIKIFGINAKAEGEFSYETNGELKCGVILD